jgi:hypothetical protein
METLDSTLWTMQSDIDDLADTVGTVNDILADAIGEE